MGWMKRGTGKKRPCRANPMCRLDFCERPCRRLLSCTSQFCSRSRLPDILDSGLMLALCAYAHRALDETMRLNDCSDEGSMVRSPWVERSNKASSADLDDRRAT